MTTNVTTSSAIIVDGINNVNFNLNTIISIVVMVYIAFNFYFLLEKFKIKD